MTAIGAQVYLRDSSGEYYGVTDDKGKPGSGEPIRVLRHGLRFELLIPRGQTNKRSQGNAIEEPPPKKRLVGKRGPSTKPK